MTGVLRRERRGRAQTHRENTIWRQRGCSDASTSQGLPRTVHSHQQLGEQRGTNSPTEPPVEPSLCECSVVSDPLRPRGLQPARPLCPWDSLGKNTGVGCHFLLQGIFQPQGWDPRLLRLLCWQADSLPPGSQQYFSFRLLTSTIVRVYFSLF